MQLSSRELALMNIEASHMIPRLGDTAYGCIQGIHLTDYHIGVIDGKKVAPKLRELEGKILYWYNIMFITVFKHWWN